MITINADQKDYSDPSNFLSNDFTSAKSFAALVGDSRTQSLTSSVHIPSLNSHQSLLSSRDEVFKEVQDVGQDNSVSSLHLFFGNMDLPPSSYHDSLEELWDEEEEPEEVETVLKVFPSVYHQFLDVFSNVKAEKRPPHRACDHHIELEGSLPPVGVIYYLSNQESDTLRAYISENVEKGFIWPSSSSTAAPVFFVKKKDGGLRLFVDYRKLNSVDRENKYPVLPMYQLLNVFNGSSIFSKIDLCGAYNLLRIKEGDEHLTAFRAKYGGYEYLVMPFGLTNAPASLQNLVNDIFQDVLDVYVVVSDSGKHPIAFGGCKRIPAELNYEIHDKELLDIVGALKCWRAFLLSLSSPFEVLTNHSSLQYFMSSKVLTRRQACWDEFLSDFHFSIPYCLGRLATLPDALSRWDDVYLERGQDFISKNPMNFQQLIQKNEVQPSRYFAVKVESFSNLIDSIQKKLWQDLQYRSILQELGKGKSVKDYSLDSSSQLLLFKDWVEVPNDPTIQLSILQKRHHSPLAGHPGQEKTLKLVKQDFLWSAMTQFIKDYVSSCQQCSRNKNIHHKKFVLLKPLPIPNRPWICLSMDFITQLPLSNSFDSILVIVDRFSKMVVFIPTMSSITSLDFAHLFINNIFSKHGLPSSIVSDTGLLFFLPFGPIFVSSSRFQEIFQLLTIKKLMDRQRG
ncbi:hypothetical protein O181_027245 [Austropuccinia psidii MF-1]|uniref:Integrase catalytic domain-containing protein n=1 Tax=Austropuccinia psidii MF-1 TaxID=1389203 RepID=A0A9Q3CQS0_9BASI|nr:hypothetical protein [Austropuccinia psidii MF-1]